MKQCTKCKKIKSDDAFYINPKNKKLRPQCKNCMILQTINYHKTIKGKQINRKAALDFYYRNKEKIKDHHKKYYQTDEGKYANALASKKYTKTHKKEVICRGKMRHLIRKNYIQRDICAICGKENAEFHHFDYNLPYCGIWLCKEHHSIIHRK